MNNIRYYLLAALFTCSLSGAHAQSGVKYPYVEDGAPIIVSHDEGGGISELALLTKEQMDFLYQMTGSEVPEYSSEYNRVSPRFQVAASTCPEKASNYTMRINACKNYNELGAPSGNWRLPTMKEAMLIWVLQTQLKASSSIDFFDHNDYYATAVKDGSNSSYIKNEASYPIIKFDRFIISDCYVRCVRDL